MHANLKRACSAIGRRLASRGSPPTPCPLTNPWPKPSALPSTKRGRKWTPAATNSTDRSERVEYKVRLDALVRGQIAGWKLSDGLLVDVYLRLNDDLPRSPTTLLRQDPTWFDS